MTTGSGGAASKADVNTEMARTRTVLAADRTLMAWVRTALSMISFGFTIYKFFHGLQEASTIHLRHAEGPRQLGLFLAALGSASVLIGLVQYVQLTRALGGPRYRVGFTAYVAAAVLALGLVVLFGLVTRMGPF